MNIKITARIAGVAVALALAACSTTPPVVDPTTSAPASATAAPLAAASKEAAPTPVTVTAPQPVTVTAPAPVTVTAAPPPPVQVPIPVPVTVTEQAPPGPNLNVIAPRIVGLPAGLLCKDLRAYGYGYWDAVDYYHYWNEPSQMDIDLNGIPCETVWTQAERNSYEN